jgi:hypothetical protein
MNWPRIVILVMDAVVLWLYVIGSIHMMVALHRHRDARREVRTVAIGRLLRYLSVVAFASANVEGTIELWGAPITPRIFVAMLALTFAMVGWLLVDRVFNDSGVFDLQAIVMRDKAST